MSENTTKMQLGEGLEQDKTDLERLKKLNNHQLKLVG